MKKTDRLNAEKTAKTAIVINVLQIIAILVLVVFLMILQTNQTKPVLFILVACALLSIFGAIIDICDAAETLHRTYAMNALVDTNLQMEQLNQEMRKQRHDFLNHLQVVYSLIEMQETGEALSYLDQTYSSLSSVSRFLKTKNTAFNALLQAKSGVCEEKGIKMTMDIHSALEKPSIPAWELCSVIGNIIDNAVYATAPVSKPEITVEVRENVHSYTIRVANNGPLIGDDIRNEIFKSGFSTKGENHGLGLTISSEIVSRYGGTLCLETKEITSFVVTVPKSETPMKSEAEVI